jgi:AcrR family transcriptional regulator
MSIKPVERQNQRMRTTIENAFQGLLREKSYEDLTVGDIVRRANVGRSTFYRYFETKTDLLIAMHETMFARLNLNMSSPNDWLSDMPSRGLIDFLTHMRRIDSRNPAYYTLTRDLTYSREMTLIIRRITLYLSDQIEQGLKAAFGGVETRMPLPLLAQSIVGIYMSAFQWWITQQSADTPAQTAHYVHRLVRAVVLEALLLPRS